MTQSFHGDTGVVAGGDVFNVTLPVAPPDDPPLAKSQRKMLNQLVEETIDITGEHGAIIWLRVHAALGVDGIDEITKSQYSTAEHCLIRMKTAALETKSRKSLVGDILTLGKKLDKGIIEDYCRLQFGDSWLLNLKKEELQQALAFARQQTQSSLPIPTAPRWKHYCSLLAILMAGIGIGLAIPSENSLADSNQIKPSREFTLTARNALIHKVLPAIRHEFPGLDKYAAEFREVSVKWSTKPRGYTIRFSIPVGAGIPAGYGSLGITCSLLVKPNGSTVQVPNKTCQSVLLDSVNTQHNNFNFKLDPDYFTNNVSKTIT